jgi:ribonuclease HI
MMKQPAENTNALPEEEAQARQSASRIYMDSPAVKEEIAMRAHHYWQQRGLPGDVPEREDWERAESFVRNRIKASQTA